MFRHEPGEDIVQDDHVCGLQQLRLSAHVAQNDLHPVLQLELGHCVLLQFAKVFVDLDADNLAGFTEIVGAIEHSTKPGANVDDGLPLEIRKEFFENILKTLLGTRVGDVCEVLSVP